MSEQQYYYVMCQRGDLVHRCYVRLDPASADILHDTLEENHDVCQVCVVKHSQVDPELLV